MKLTTRKAFVIVLLFSLILGVTAVAFAMVSRPPSNDFNLSALPEGSSGSLMLAGAILLFLGSYLRKKLPRFGGTK